MPKNIFNFKEKEMTQYQTQNWNAKIEDLTCFGSAIRTEKEKKHCYFNELFLLY